MNEEISQNNLVVPTVSIIILNFNGGEFLLECISAVEKTVSVKKEIILIDNASTDDSHFICKQKFPEIILFQNKNNMGLTARNIGIENAKGEFIVFLDSDTIVQKNWFDNLQESYEKHGEGLYQPKLLDPSEQCIINSCGNMINVFGIGYSRGRGEKDIGQYDCFEKVTYTSGACTFSKRITIKKIGFIDKIFFQYHDDLDYGWRAQLLGIPSFYEPNSTVFHKGSTTLMWSKKKFFFLERNRWICLMTLLSRKSLLKISPFLLVFEISLFFFFLSKGMGITKIKSFFSLISKRNEIHEKYVITKNKRILSDAQIIENFSTDVELPSIIIKPKSYKIIRNIVRKLLKISYNLIKT